MKKKGKKKMCSYIYVYYFSNRLTHWLEFGKSLVFDKIISYQNWRTLSKIGWQVLSKAGPKWTSL